MFSIRQFVRTNIPCQYQRWQLISQSECKMRWQLRKWPSASWVDLEANIHECLKTKPSEIRLKQTLKEKILMVHMFGFLSWNLYFPCYINEHRTCKWFGFLLPCKGIRCSNFVPDQSCKEHTCTFQRVVAASQCCKYPKKLYKYFTKY